MGQFYVGDPGQFYIGANIPTSEDAQRWHNDPDYQTLAEHRHRASRANIVLVDGLD